MPMVATRGVGLQGGAVDLITGRMAREIHEQGAVRTTTNNEQVAVVTFKGALHCDGQMLSLPVLPHPHRPHPEVVAEVFIIRMDAQVWPMTTAP